MGCIPTPQTPQIDFIFVLLGLLPVFIIFAMWFAMLAAAIAVYIFRAFGLYKMAKNTAMPNPWLAWIPIAHEYLAASMGDRGNAARGKKTNFGRWVLIALGAIVAVTIFMLVQMPLFVARAALYDRMSLAIVPNMVLFIVCYLLAIGGSVAVKVLDVLSHYYLYRDFEPENVVLYTVLTVFGLDIVCKLLLRENIPVSIAGRHPYRQPKYKPQAAPNGYRPF